jgi:hypothetical protein
MSFDLKTATPDVTFTAGALLFGADSQSATNPSVYALTTVFDYLKTLPGDWTAAQTIAVNSSSPALKLTQTGAGDVLVVEDTASTDTTPFAVGTDGSVRIGTPTADRQFHVEVDDATNTGVTYLARFCHTTSGSPGNGMGVGLEFEIETSAANNEVGGTLEFVTTDVTAASEDVDLVVKLMAGGSAAAEALRVKLGTPALHLAGTKIIGARVTGWTAATGSATRTTFDAGTVTTAQLAERVKALIDDLIAHGLIGT